MNATYEAALSDALDLMDMGIEPTSALKQGATDQGIAFGPAMGAFVTWALNSGLLWPYRQPPVVQ